MDPIQTIDSAFFWSACEEKKLVVQACGSCGKLWHPPRPICPDCHSVEKEPRQLSGKGSILSWVRPVHPPAFGFDTPPVVILVELEEGVRLVSNFEGENAPEFGQKVEVNFTPTKSGKTLPIFQPVES